MTAPVAFKLKATVAGTLPVAFGQTFVKGAVPSGSYAHVDALTGVSVIPVRRWNDGSIKIARVVGQFPLPTTALTQFNIRVDSVAPAGTPLTAAAITTALAGRTDTYIRFGTLGDIALHTLLSSPVRTFISDVNNVECHYQARLPGDARLYGKFHVSLIGGRLEIDAIWGNGSIADTVMGTVGLKDYQVNVVIGGATIYDSLYHHWPLQYPMVTGWIGGDPQVEVRPDTQYMMLNDLVQNNAWKYGQTDQATIDSWSGATKVVNLFGPQFTANLAYTPGENCCLTPNMRDPGYQDGIGLSSTWDALYLQNGALQVFDRIVKANGKAFNSFGVAWVDPTTLSPFQLSDYPTNTVYGANGGGADSSYVTKTQDGLTNLFWQGAHSCPGGYLAWLITTKYYYMETQAFNALSFYMTNTSSGGNTGTNRGNYGEKRAVAWMMKTVAQVAATSPDSLSSIYGQFETWLYNFVSTEASFVATPPLDTKAFAIGLTRDYGGYNNSGLLDNGEVGLKISPWQAYYCAIAAGFASKIDALTDAHKAPLIAYRDFVMKFVVGLAGGGGAGEFNICQAGVYVVSVRTKTQFVSNDGEPTGPPAATWNSDSFGQIFSDSFGVTNFADTALRGSSGSDPASNRSYWGVFGVALAYCADCGAPGAAAAHARFVSIPNFATDYAITAQYNNFPQTAVMPKSYAMPVPNFTPVDSGGSVTTPGPSLSFDRTPILGAGTLVLSKYRGMGIPLSAITGGGSDGTSPIYDAIQAAGGTVSSLSEIRLVAAAGTHGTYSPDETGGGVYSGDGSSDTVNVDYYLDGAQINSAPMYFGTSPSDTASPTMNGSITASAITSSSFTLSWPAASDNVAVTGYEVSIDGGSNYVNVGNVLTTNKTGLTASTDYPTRVRAYDAANNRATPLSLTVTTSATIPTVPGNKTFTIALGTGPTSAAANLTGLSVSFYDEQYPHQATTAKYQTSTGSTNSLGVLTFTCQSSLSTGQQGHVTIYGASGMHYNGMITAA